MKTKTITLPVEHWETILNTISYARDEGPEDEGWKSDELRKAEALLESALHVAPPIKISGPIELFRTGQCMAFHNGEQVGELQKSFFELWADNAKAHGFNPDGAIISTPAGRVKIIKTEFGWNFDLL
jgi:hypothetical protein